MEMQTTLLVNRQSGYLAIGKKTVSKYQGGYISDGTTLLRTLEDTTINDEDVAESISQNGQTAFRNWQNGCTEAFRLQENTILYEREKKATTTIFLDCKQSYDNRSFGRDYQVSKHKNGILVSYRKGNDPAEKAMQEYSYFVFLQLQITESQLLEEWVRHEYPYDAAREHIDPERYVFALLKTSAAKFALTAGTDKKKVMAEAERYTDFFGDDVSLFDDAKEVTPEAEASAKDALLGLVSGMHGRPGLLAGFPWFFQYWTRDEAISARGLMLCGNQQFAKAILLHLIEQIDADGRIPNRIPAADLGCADGVGWVFLRLYQLWKTGDLSKSELKKVTAALLLSLARLEEHLFADGLVTNRPLETWMDTEHQGDVRSGSRIEIQALTLAMYRFAALLTEDQSWSAKEESMKERVRAEFWHNDSLFDGKDDPTIRPNLFLAAYVYPELLKKTEWERCFDIALEKLWLEWGGLATIQTDHPLFQNHYTGQDNRSYHRGDSWYFVNAFAAIALQRCNARKYQKFISAISQACANDICELGAFGAASEVSSAAEQKSHGCWSQAWSNAVFVELCHELREGKKTK